MAMHCTDLSIIDLTGGEQRIKRVVSRNQEPREINEELAGDVKEDQEEIDSNKAEEGIDLRDRGLLFQIVQGRVLGKLQTTISMVLGQQRETLQQPMQIDLEDTQTGTMVVPLYQSG